MSTYYLLTVATAGAPYLAEYEVSTLDAARDMLAEEVWHTADGAAHGADTEKLIDQARSIGAEGGEIVLAGFTHSIVPIYRDRI
jgi:hypothetical protein